ncbi:hypothetical protein ACIHCQ_01575 [Streptomyces sp. NPDC052236]|uniref:hypothetical protein n=1 Tax=Streptomyces sp. NPDC052236 TaxID=3365686 RepID=UPI0037D3B152
MSTRPDVVSPTRAGSHRFTADGAQGITTSIGMGVVALGAGLGLRKGSGQRQGRRT